ncbi:MAG: diguanylate cyclase, partial [Actinomycetota bacterium]|nr:diguanylate cyclase [Actinomycetota bacterium]
MADTSPRVDARDPMESEDGWRRVLENSSDLVFVLDDHGTLTYVSPASERMLGYHPLARVGDSVFDLVHPDDVGRATEAFGATIARGGIAPRLEVRVRTADGDWRELEVIANNLLEDPVVHGIIVNGRDLSERRVAAENLAASESRFEYAFEHAAVGMTITSADGQFLRVNQALCTLLGFSAIDFVGMSFFDLTHPDDLTRTKEGVRALLAGEDAPYVLDKRYRCADGSYTWVRVRASIMHATRHRPTQLLGYVEDIAARRALEANLEYDATHDRLTGLSTRTVLYDQLERALASRRRGGNDVAVLFVDLDRFKLVNDTFGHLEGDVVLREVAERIKATVRPSDLPARLGGDEFVVCAPALRDPADAVQIAERLVEALQVPIASDGQTIVIGASVGIAFARDDSDPDQLLRDSDHAVYRAKERGRGRVEVFDRRLQRRIDLRRQSERAIDRHLTDGTLEFALWPIVSLEPRTVIGFDCRIDWDAIGLGTADVDALFESPARAMRLDMAVVRSMLGFLGEWKSAFPLGEAPGIGTMLESLGAAS